MSGCLLVESLCFDALLFRFGCYNNVILERVGTSTTAVGVAMLLNHKQYFNFNTTSINQSVNQ